MDELVELLEYRDGKLYWKVDIGSKVKAGDRAGTTVGKAAPYRAVRYKGSKYYEHRIIYYMFNKYLPEQIDHIDGDPSHNCIKNLRPATGQQNQRNKCSKEGASSKFKGVSWNKYHKKWVSRVWGGKSSKHLGLYKCEIEAAKAYDKRASELFGEYARPNFPEDFK